MVVKIKYSIDFEVLHEMTPEEVCLLHSGEIKDRYIPKEATKWDYEFLNKELAEQEMNEYFYR